MFFSKCYFIFNIYQIKFYEKNVSFGRSLDKEKIGKITEKCFRKIMLEKEDVNSKDVEEMLEEYYRQ